MCNNLPPSRLSGNDWDVLYIPGKDEDILAASFIGISGVVLGWKYSSLLALRFTATIHSSTPY